MVSSCPSLPGRSAKSRYLEWRETYCFKEWSENDFVKELLQRYINFQSECRLTVYLTFNMKELQFSLANVSYWEKGAIQWGFLKLFAASDSFYIHLKLLTNPIFSLRTSS